MDDESMDFSLSDEEAKDSEEETVGYLIPPQKETTKTSPVARLMCRGSPKTLESAH